jgi:hypothetical protein
LASSAARDPIRERFPRVADLLAIEPEAEESERLAHLRAAGSIGRPLGDDRFLARVERVTKQRKLGGPRRRPDRGSLAPAAVRSGETCGGDGEETCRTVREASSKTLCQTSPPSELVALLDRDLLITSGFALA